MSDVLELIDGAIRGHGDAMRWIPESDREAYPAKPLLTDWQREVVRQHFDELADVLRAHVEAAKPALQQLGDHLRELGDRLHIVFDEVAPYLEARRAHRRHLHSAYRGRMLARKRRRR